MRPSRTSQARAGRVLTPPAPTRPPPGAVGTPASGQSGPSGPGLTPPSPDRPPRAAGGAARAGPARLGRVGHAPTLPVRVPRSRRRAHHPHSNLAAAHHPPRPAARVQVEADGPARSQWHLAPGQPRARMAAWVPDRTTAAGGGPSVGCRCTAVPRLGRGRAGPRRRRDSYRDRGAGPGSRTGQWPPPRHPLPKVTLERSLKCRTRGSRDPFNPCTWCKPQLLLRDASIHLAALRILAPLIFSPVTRVPC